MNNDNEEERSVLLLEFEVDLTDEEWKELGYDPEAMTEDEIEELIDKVGELEEYWDFMPLLRRAARALGRDVMDGDAKDETNDS
ncbi:MAG: hypothetical protein ACM3Q4_11470 [Acidobacteriota bacterium]